VEATYTRTNGYVDAVRMQRRLLPACEGVSVDCREIGELTFDISTAATTTPSWSAEDYRDMRCLGGDLVRLSPILRRLLTTRSRPVHRRTDHPRRQPHPLDRATRTRRLTPQRRLLRRQGDRPQPAAPGTSARIEAAGGQGKLKVGDDFIHESIIGSLFNGRVEAAARVGNHDAIIQSIEGWAASPATTPSFIDDRIL